MIKEYLSLIIGTILTFISYILGGWDTAIQSLIVVFALDYFTGILKAIKEKNLNSKKELNIILKKVGYLFICALAVVLDRIMIDNGAIRNLVIYFFVANEGISIIENWGSMGLPLPPQVTEILEQLKNSKMNKL